MLKQISENICVFCVFRRRAAATKNENEKNEKSVLLSVIEIDKKILILLQNPQIINIDFFPWEKRCI